jgi:hypothetical protein
MCEESTNLTGQQLLEIVREEELLDVSDDAVEIKVAFARKGYFPAPDGIAVVLTPKLSNGRLAGCGAHPGFVVGVTLAQLEMLGLDWQDLCDSDETRIDPDNRQMNGICVECAGESGLDWEELEESTDDKCWSCLQMTLESLQSEELRESV